MKVHLVTTARNEQRRAEFAEAWRDWEIIPHIAPDHRDLGVQQHKRLFAIACCSSGHLGVWQSLRNVLGWHLIAEDDARPTPRILAAIQLAIKRCGRMDVIKMHHHAASMGDAMQVIRLPASEWVSTACYLIRNTERVLGRYKCLGPIDRTLSRIAIVGAVCPPPIGLRDTTSIPKDWT